MNIPNFIVFLLVMLAVPNAEERNSKEPKILQGEWVLIETADEKRADRGHDSIRMVIRDGAVVLKIADLITNEGTIKIGMMDGKQAIDMHLANGKDVVGIFDLKGDTLIICVDDSANRRPQTLTPKGTQWAEKWKRLKR